MNLFERLLKDYPVSVYLLVLGYMVTVALTMFVYLYDELIRNNKITLGELLGGIIVSLLGPIGLIASYIALYKNPNYKPKFLNMVIYKRKETT